MPNRPAEEDIARAIFDALAPGFTKVKLVDVKVTRREDDYGFDAFDAMVVYRGAFRNLNVRKMVSASSDVQPTLDSLGETGFPVISFVSYRDFKALAAERSH